MNSPTSSSNTNLRQQRPKSFIRTASKQLIKRFSGNLYTDGRTPPPPPESVLFSKHNSQFISFTSTTNSFKENSYLPNFYNEYGEDNNSAAVVDDDDDDDELQLNKHYNNQIYKINNNINEIVNNGVYIKTIDDYLIINPCRPQRRPITQLYRNTF